MHWPHLAIPTVLTFIATLGFLALERIRPGRPLPPAKGWYGRAILLNGMQLGLTLLTNKIWSHVFAGRSVLHLAAHLPPAAQGFTAWFVGTFFYYWWHRLRHVDGFWHVLHQIHHSPARIEIATSFYKHPLEMLADTMLSATIGYGLLGVSLAGAFWFNFFAAVGEYFYHGNFRSPRWLKYFIQTPELHSIHHQLHVHRYNFSDLTLWDRVFGTYRDEGKFADACGFPNDNERRLLSMLRFQDVYDLKNE